MFSFNKSEWGQLPLAQEDEESDALSEAMLDHEYPERKTHSRIWRVCTSNIPWIFTTLALLLYIFIFAPIPQEKNVPWSSTDIGKFLLLAINGQHVLSLKYILVI